MSSPGTSRFSGRWPHNFSMDVAYVGNHGVDQPLTDSTSRGNYAELGIRRQPLYVKFGKKNGVTSYFSGYSSMYNGLQIKLSAATRTAFSLTRGGHPPTGKAMGMQSEEQRSRHLHQPRRNWRRLGFDRKFYFVQSYVYELRLARARSTCLPDPPDDCRRMASQRPSEASLPVLDDVQRQFGGSECARHNNTLNWFGPGAIPVTKATAAAPHGSRRLSATSRTMENPSLPPSASRSLAPKMGDNLSSATLAGTCLAVLASGTGRFGVSKLPDRRAV